MKKQPTHRLCVKHRVTGATGVIGAGWLNEDGSVSLALDPCVVIAATDNVFLTLFPVDAFCAKCRK